MSINNVLIKARTKNIKIPDAGIDHGIPDGNLQLFIFCLINFGYFSYNCALLNFKI